MLPPKYVSVVEMKTGETGTVVEVSGGWGLVRRLESLGIRPGNRVTKLSSVFMRGPVTLVVNRAQIAIGFGMARRIMVQLENK